MANVSLCSGTSRKAAPNGDSATHLPATTAASSSTTPMAEVALADAALANPVHVQAHEEGDGDGRRRW